MKKRKNLRYLRSLGSGKSSLFLISAHLTSYYRVYSNLPPYKNIFNYFMPSDWPKDYTLPLNYTKYGLSLTFAYRVFAGWNFFFNPKKRPKNMLSRAWLTRYGQRDFQVSSYQFPRSFNNFLPLSFESYRYILSVMLSGFGVRTPNNSVTGPTHLYSQNVASSLSHVLHDTKYRAFEFLLKDIPSASSYMHPRDIFNYTLSLYSKISTRVYYNYVKFSYKVKNFSYILFSISGIISRNFLWFYRLLRTTLFAIIFILYSYIFHHIQLSKLNFIDNWLERRVVLRMYAQMAEKHYADVLKLTYARAKYPEMSFSTFKMSPKPDFETLYKTLKAKAKKVEPEVVYQEPEDKK